MPMARADRTDNGVESGVGIAPAEGAADVRLVELLRTSTVTAYPALQELRARHRGAVLAYARLCTTGDSTAGQLAAQAFTLAARQIAGGSEPLVPLRHELLLLTARSAASWAGDERAAGLDPGLLMTLGAPPPEGPLPPLLGAFQSLPTRAQGLIWYGVVERELHDRTAVLLGLTPEDVAHEIPSALQAMAHACLRSRLAASDDPRCGNFGRLIEESVRPDNPRESADLRAHMVHCVHCTAAHAELTALRDAPRRALAEGLLPWAGPAYATREETRPQATRRSAAGARRSGPLAGATTWPPSRRVLLTSVAVAVALTPLLVLLFTRTGGSPSAPSGQAADVTGAPTSAPQVTANVSPTPSASPSVSASASAGAHSHSPSRSSSPSRSAKPSPSPAAHAPNGTYAQIVNVSTGRCLDIGDGGLGNGTDVVTAPCTSSDTQRWRVDTGRGVVQSYADSDYCLDSRGDVGKGVGIWECDSVTGDHGQNLRFTVDPDGVIRPAIAIETGVTPAGGDAVALRPLDGGAAQRWRAGAR